MDEASGAYEYRLEAVVTAHAVHPPGTELDEHGHPIVREEGQPNDSGSGQRASD